MVNSLYSRNSCSITSRWSVDPEDKLYSFNSCSKKHYPHGKSVFICAICGRKKNNYPGSRKIRVYMCPSVCKKLFVRNAVLDGKHSN